LSYFNKDFGYLLTMAPISMDHYITDSQELMDFVDFFNKLGF